MITTVVGMLGPSNILFLELGAGILTVGEKETSKVCTVEKSEISSEGSLGGFLFFPLRL